MLKQLREWMILIVGLAVIVIGLSTAPLMSGSGGSDQKPQATAVADNAEPPAQSAQTPQKPQKPQQSAAVAPAQKPAAPPAATTPASAAAPAKPAAPAPAAAPMQHQHAQVAQSAAPAASAPRPIAPSAMPVPPSAPVAAPPGAAQDPKLVSAGRLVFRKCQACHSLEPGKNGIGPTLAGIMGAKAGHIANYNYSAAVKNSNLTWDIPTLDAYLADPQKKIPGNKMPFPGLKTDNERNSVIAFIASMTGTANAAPAAASAPVAQPQAAAPRPAQTAQAPAAPATQPAPQGQGAANSAASPPSPPPSYLPGVRYTLRSGIAEGRMVFLGVGGTIDGQINPVLSAAQGQVVQVTLVNGEGAEHDIVFDRQGPGGASPHIVGRGSSTNIAFVAGAAGDYTYFCSLPGHRLAGMEGQFLVTPTPPPQTVVEADISQVSSDVPAPIGKRGPQTVRVDLVTVELEGRLAEGTTFGYWTFNGKVPGPMLRVRVGDTVDVHVKNADGSAMIHSVDFHAATGPGGGAVSTQVNPGEEKSFKFKALVPGLYVYHCATPMVAHHIANGMYGMILVEPEEGLPPVDREFYVMQGEIYTEGAFGQHGSQEFNVEKMLNERPEYFVFNGSVGALSKFHPLQAKVGETVRIFFGVGGPNFTSSFHVIGEIFDKVYTFGGVLSEPLRGVQTVTVPAGGAVIVDFKVDVPGNYVLVDHALARAERGLVGMLHVEGPPNTEIYDGKVEPGSGH